VSPRGLPGRCSPPGRPAVIAQSHALGGRSFSPSAAGCCARATWAGEPGGSAAALMESTPQASATHQPKRRFIAFSFGRDGGRARWAPFPLSARSRALPDACAGRAPASRRPASDVTCATRRGEDRTPTDGQSRPATRPPRTPPTGAPALALRPCWGTEGRVAGGRLQRVRPPGGGVISRPWR